MALDCIAQAAHLRCMDITELRSQQFPVTERYTYLNHAAVAPVSVAVRQAMDEIVGGAADHGLAQLETWRQLYATARDRVAALVGAQPSQVAFLKNTTDGLIAVALGVDWRAGDNVVLARGEFPANVYPWLNLANRGVQVRWVAERQNRLCVDDFAAAINEKTRVLSVSSVEFFSGFRNDLAALGQLCRERGVLFVVDGIQSVGALQIDFQTLGIDCLAADGHKWLMGPEGCALFVVSAKALSQLQIAGLGWASVQSAYDFLEYDTRLYEDARRFETGTHNTAGIAGLQAAVNLLLDVGMPYVESRILDLTQRLVQGLESHAYHVLGSRQPHEASGIVTFVSEHTTSQQLSAVLSQGGVQHTERGGTVRLSPHVYNTEDEIDAVIEMLREPA